MTTALRPFKQWSPFGDFRNEMDTLMERFFGGESNGTEISNWTPRLNLAENEDCYEVSIDLPGMNPDDVNVELRHGDLWITGNRHEQFEEKEKKWHRIERFHGEFRRVVRLGDDVDPENVEAEYKDGVLHISVPKSETAKTKRIEIKR